MGQDSGCVSILGVSYTPMNAETCFQAIARAHGLGALVIRIGLWGNYTVNKEPPKIAKAIMKPLYAAPLFSVSGQGCEPQPASPKAETSQAGRMRKMSAWPRSKSMRAS